MTVREFQLAEIPPLSRSAVPRDESVRADPDQLATLWEHGRIVLVDRHGRTPVLDGGQRLADRAAADYGDTPPEGASLLAGAGELAYWSLPVEQDFVDTKVPVPGNGWAMWTGGRTATGEEWHDLRSIGGLLDDTSAGLFTTAIALHNWHRTAKFCARDGSPVRVVKAGWATVCTECGREEYPRTDPAIICLVHDGEGPNGTHVLLARQPIWPQGRFSVLAGFVEAGESMEACVEREILEEVGVRVTDIRYLGNQPWPFPRSLMIGFTAVADRSAAVAPSDGEIEEARWVHRDEVLAAIDAGGETDGFVLPGATSIARQMLAGWAMAGD